MSLERDYKKGLKIFMKIEGYKTKKAAIKAVKKLLEKIVIK